MPTLFDPAKFQSALSTSAIGRFLIYRERTETTMILARREAEEGAPHGAIVLAEEQTAGRGRKGRSFHSPAEENLYFTLILRLPLDSHRRLPLSLPLAVASAVAAEGVDARIKWPNDVWVGERKLCGMLIDAEMTGSEALAMPGIGINVNGDPTVIPGLASIATSISRELGRAISRELLLARICNEVERTSSLSPADLAAAYREMSLVLGRTVIVTPIASDPFEAIATDIDETGALIVTLPNGESRVLNAAEVTLRPAH
ncbi:MAG: biotin--[acetyl-CoA-carboxylase] ligase [Dehalococcoidia bacterium]|nr:biotin--[acetyl-CoA-carboxylase] ligase [Dehalococcoidia bacterium]